MKVMVGDQPLLVDGKPLQVIFSYDPPLSPQDAKRRKGKAVACYLKQPSDGTGPAPPPIAVGMAFQHPLDKFDKTIGRKEALKHALEQAPLPREQRALVWAWFFTVCRQPERDR